MSVFKVIIRKPSRQGELKSKQLGKVKFQDVLTITSARHLFTFWVFKPATLRIKNLKSYPCYLTYFTVVALELGCAPAAVSPVFKAALAGCIVLAKVVSAKILYDKRKSSSNYCYVEVKGKSAK